MRVKSMTVAEGKRVNISRFPNFDRRGSIRGMKKLYYGEMGIKNKWKKTLVTLKKLMVNAIGLSGKL